MAWLGALKVVFHYFSVHIYMQVSEQRNSFMSWGQIITGLLQPDQVTSNMLIVLLQ